MNCKPGDLAVIVKSWGGNLGVFLRVLKLDRSDNTWTFEDASRPIRTFRGEIAAGAYRSSAEAGGNAWVCDEELRPIRDQPGEDQTLQWAGLPHKETA